MRMQHTRARVHGGVRQLVGVHPPRPLSLDVVVVSDALLVEVGQFAGQLVIGIRVDIFALCEAVNAMRCSGSTAAYT